MDEKLSQLTVMQVYASLRFPEENTEIDRTQSVNSNTNEVVQSDFKGDGKETDPSVAAQSLKSESEREACLISPQEDINVFLGQGRVRETLPALISEEACGYSNVLDLNITPLGGEIKANRTVPYLVSKQCQEEGSTVGDETNSKPFGRNKPKRIRKRHKPSRGRGRRSENHSSNLQTDFAINGNWKKPVSGRGRGRGRPVFVNGGSNRFENSDNKFVSELLGNVNGIPQMQSPALKNVICNAVTFKSDLICEYNLRFQPEIKSETYRYGFLKKHFTYLNKLFIYNKSTIFVPELLDNNQCKFDLMVSATSKVVYTMTLWFKQFVKLPAHPELLCRILEEVIVVPEFEIMPDFTVQIREGFLCLNYQNYRLEKTLPEIVLNLENNYPERIEEELTILLKNSRISYKKKIYKILGINLEKRRLELARNNLQISGKFKYCTIAKKNILFHPQPPKEFMFYLKKTFSSDFLQKGWKLELGDFIKAKARVLKPETIMFGEGVEYTPIDGNWEKKMRENKVTIPTELYHWTILFTRQDKMRAERFSRNIRRLENITGIPIRKPILFQIESESEEDYVHALNSLNCKELQFLVVIIPISSNKPEALIKHFCCALKSIPYQLINAWDVDNPLKVHQNTLQLNLISGGIPWTIKLPYRNWMICGIDVTENICSFVTTLNSDATQWYSKATDLTDNFLNDLSSFLDDSLIKYQSTNGRLPSHLIMYQNCTHKTRHKFHEDYKNFSWEKIKLCVILVEKQTNLRIYKDLKSGADFVPPGTIVDNTIINPSARDFFLTSVKDCCTYYDVIKDTAGLTDEQLETITYKMCHLFYKCAKTVEVPAPCLYAQTLSRLIADDVYDLPHSNLDECLYYL